MLAAAVMTMMLPLIGMLIPLPEVGPGGVEPVLIPNEPEVALGLTARSGPIVIEIDYRVDPAEARSFYGKMLQLQNARLRNGAFEWSIARDVGDAALWTERFHFPTWQDYQRQRDRFTQADLELQAAADAFNTLAARDRLRRRLERPTGSVRWRAETPDPQSDTIGIYTP
jgi:hypothetical protein